MKVWTKQPGESRSCPRCGANCRRYMTRRVPGSGTFLAYWCEGCRRPFGVKVEEPESGSEGG